MGGKFEFQLPDVEPALKYGFLDIKRKPSAHELILSQEGKSPSINSYGVGVGVSVGVEVGVVPPVGVGVGVSAGVSVGVAAGLVVGVAVGFTVAVGVTFKVAVGVAVTVTVIVGVGAKVGVGVAVSVCPLPERKRKYPIAPRIIPTTTAEIIFFQFIPYSMGSIHYGVNERYCSFRHIV